jgi:hypothetical protein
LSRKCPEFVRFGDVEFARPDCLIRSAGLAGRSAWCFARRHIEGVAMTDEPTKTNPNGLPEKIGTAFGFTRDCRCFQRYRMDGRTGGRRHVTIAQRIARFPRR